MQKCPSGCAHLWSAEREVVDVQHCTLVGAPAHVRQPLLNECRRHLLHGDPLVEAQAHARGDCSCCHSSRAFEGGQVSKKRRHDQYAISTICSSTRHFNPFWVKTKVIECPGCRVRGPQPETQVLWRTCAEPAHARAYTRFAARRLSRPPVDRCQPSCASLADCLRVVRCTAGAWGHRTFCKDAKKFSP
jgi:hypothetical protein